MLSAYSPLKKCKRSKNHANTFLITATFMSRYNASGQLALAKHTRSALAEISLNEEKPTNYLSWLLFYRVVDPENLF
jgi:hypothetical protein